MFETIKGWFGGWREKTAEELQIVAKQQQQLFIRNMIREIVDLADEQAKAGWFYAAYRLPLVQDKEVEDAVKHRLIILGYKFEEQVRDSRRYLAISWREVKDGE